MEKISPFKIIGISVRTSNKDGKSAKDIGALWYQFDEEKISDKIKNKKSLEIFVLYTDYESGFTGKYTAIIGHKVDSIKDIPVGCIGRNFEGGQYKKFLAKGEMPEAIIKTWQEIWEKDKELNRKYEVDFELYGRKSQDEKNSEVEIFIG